MDCRGDIRTAYEFKDIFADSGVSHRPYRCPFCEVPYEDRCIVTECVKAPHFKLPKGTKHRGNCDGEPEIEYRAEPAVSPARVVVGDVDVPEALVARRNPRRVIPAGATPAAGTSPSDEETRRRRKMLAAERTLDSKFTSYLLQQIVLAHRKLMKAAFDQASAAKLTRGSSAYGEMFKTVLEERALDLFGQRLTYRSAFLGSRLSPSSRPRIYSGSGAVENTGSDCVITDKDTWPREFKSSERVPLIVCVPQVPAAGAPVVHLRAIEELQRMGEQRDTIHWWAYGAARLDGAGRWVLTPTSLDHLCWEVVSRPASMR